MIQAGKGIVPGRVLFPLILSGWLLISCKSTAPTLSASPDFPLFESGSALHMRASSKELTPYSAAVTVELVAKAIFPDVSVSVVSGDSALSVTPTACHLLILKPPTIEHALRPPYPLPAIPLCTFIVTARAPGQYPVVIHVEGTNGKTVLSPVAGVVTFKGERP